MNRTIKIVAFASGGGTTLDALLNACTNQVSWSIVGLLVNNSLAQCVNVAKAHDLPVFVFNPGKYDSTEAWDFDIVHCLHSIKPDLIVLMGFLKKLGPRTVREFHGKILNTHPSLLPKYGGPGMYGNKIYEAVLANKETETGVTLHYVTEEYDRGEIIKQIKIPVRPGDTVDSLSRRVKQQEKAMLIEYLSGL